MTFKHAIPNSAWGRNGIFKPYEAWVGPLGHEEVYLEIVSKRPGHGPPISIRMHREDAIDLGHELASAGARARFSWKDSLQVRTKDD